MFNDSNGISRFNSSLSVLTDFQNIYASFTFMGKTNEATNTFDRQISRGTINSCNVARGMAPFFFMKSALESFQKYSNYTTACPQKKGTYNCANFPVFDDNLLPLGLFKLTGSIEISAVVKGKLDHIKSMVHLGIFKGKVEIVPNY